MAVDDFLNVVAFQIDFKMEGKGWIVRLPQMIDDCLFLIFF